MKTANSVFQDTLHNVRWFQILSPPPISLPSTKFPPLKKGWKNKPPGAYWRKYGNLLAVYMEISKIEEKDFFDNCKTARTQ